MTIKKIKNPLFCYDGSSRYYYIILLCALLAKSFNGVERDCGRFKEDAPMIRVTTYLYVTSSTNTWQPKASCMQS